MATLFLNLQRDERGFVVSTELVLIATLCVLGLVTGLSCVRDAINGELGDVAKSIGSLNQSYAYSGFHSCVSPKCGVHAWTVGSTFTDVQDEQAAEIEGGDAVQPAPQPAPVVEPAPLPCPMPVIEAAPAIAPLPCPTLGPSLCPEVIAPAAIVTDCCPSVAAPVAGSCCESRVTTVSPAAPCCPQPLGGDFPFVLPPGGQLIW